MFSLNGLEALRGMGQNSISGEENGGFTKGVKFPNSYASVSVLLLEQREYFLHLTAKTDNCIWLMHQPALEQFLTPGFFNAQNCHEQEVVTSHAIRTQ